MQTRPLGQEDPLEENMATTLVFLPGEPTGRGAWGLQSTGPQESDMTEAT